MAKTYVPISTQTLGSATASVTFSSISGAYTDLLLVCNAQTSLSTVDLLMRINGDTGTNYSSTHLSGNGTSAISSRNTGLTYMIMNSYGYLANLNYMGVYKMNFQNYSNTTTYKTVLSSADQQQNGLARSAGLWRSTSAISTILVYPDGSKLFDVGSCFTLYGILAA